MTRATTLYRFRNASGSVLYIGTSMDPLTRWNAHSTRGWWEDVADISVEHFPDRVSALAAEREAIRTEEPLHNVQSKPGLRRLPRAPRLVSDGEVILSVRVSRETADRLKVVADRNYRPVAAHLRFLIDTDIAEQPQDIAA